MLKHSVPATEPEDALAVLSEHGYRAMVSTYRTEKELVLYEIYKDGLLQSASIHPQTFWTQATVLRMLRYKSVLED